MINNILYILYLYSDIILVIIFLLFYINGRLRCIFNLTLSLKTFSYIGSVCIYDKHKFLYFKLLMSFLNISHLNLNLGT